MKGGDWTHKIFFDPSADNRAGSINLITFGDLIEQFENSVIPNARIKSVYLYKVPLYECQKTNYILYHEYVAVKTSDEMWFSFEKNSKGIIIQ